MLRFLQKTLKLGPLIILLLSTRSALLDLLKHDHLILGLLFHQPPIILLGGEGAGGLHQSRLISVIYYFHNLIDGVTQAAHIAICWRTAREWA